MEIGEKIKRLRIKKDLTQEELADRCELTKGFISQLERDLTSPSIATLVDILEGLGTNLSDFFNERPEEKIVFTEEDFFVSENEELNYTTNWIIPNAQKNMMEPILVEIDSYGQTKEDYPHEGEEFGYVLNGNIIIHLGDDEYKVRAGESFYYKANLYHYISNPGKTKARVVWISTPPNF